MLIYSETTRISYALITNQKQVSENVVCNDEQFENIKTKIFQTFLYSFIENELRKFGQYYTYLPYICHYGDCIMMIYFLTHPQVLQTHSHREANKILNNLDYNKISLQQQNEQITPFMKTSITKYIKKRLIEFAQVSQFNIYIDGIELSYKFLEQASMVMEDLIVKWGGFQIPDLDHSSNVAQALFPQSKVINFTYKKKKLTIKPMNLIYRTLDSYQVLILWLLQEVNKSEELSTKTKPMTLQPDDIINIYRYKHMDIYIPEIMVTLSKPWLNTEEFILINQKPLKTIVTPGIMEKVINKYTSWLKTLTQKIEKHNVQNSVLKTMKTMALKCVNNQIHNLDFNQQTSLKFAALNQVFHKINPLMHAFAQILENTTLLNKELILHEIYVKLYQNMLQH